MNRVSWTRKRVVGLLIVMLCAGVFIAKLPWVFSVFRQMTYLEFSDAPTEEAVVSDELVTEIYLDRGIAGSFELLDSVSVRIPADAAEPAEIMLLDPDGRTLANLIPEREANADGEVTLNLKIPSLTGAGLSGAQKIRFYEDEDVPYPVSSISSVRVYGGSRNLFGIIWAFAEEVLLLVLLVLALRAYRAGENILNNHIYTAILLAILSFSVRYVLTTNLVPTSADENETLLAAFVQKNGGVLYKDYVTLHMPAVYWLTGLFSRLGASAVMHFRLCFQFIQCVIWSLVYFRHRNSGARYAAAILSLAWGPISYLFAGETAFEILPDQLAALAMGVLFLELHAYSRDHRLRLSRAAVISACIFTAVQSCLLAIFPVLAVLFFFISEELRFSRKRLRRPPAGYYRSRYLWPFGIVLLPFAVTILVMLINGSLKEAFSQNILFNLEVYTGYIELGGTPLRFLISGFANIWALFASTLTSVLSGQLVMERIVECLILLICLVFFILEGRRYGAPRALCLIFFFGTLAARNSVNFHSLMLWSAAFLYLLTRIPAFSAGEEVLPVRRRRARGDRPNAQETFQDPIRRSASSIFATKLGVGVTAALVTIFILIFGVPYLQMAARSLAAGPTRVSSAELLAVRNVEPGKTLFIDTTVLNSCYVPSKGRLPVNRAAQVLPWYCEWYAGEMEKNLRENLPAAMLYHPDPTLWNYSGYAKGLDAAAGELYEASGAEGLLFRKETAAAG